MANFNGGDIEQFQYLMRDLPRLWRSLLDQRLNPMGLSQAKWRALYSIGGSQEPITQTMLAERLSIEAPTVVRLVDRLEEDGWIERRGCVADRRVRHIHLTPKAMKVYHEIDAVVNDVREQILGKVKASDLRACNVVLQRLVDAARAAMVTQSGDVNV
jgi:MarR family transcriptional regulator for hemolysin